MAQHLHQLAAGHTCAQSTWNPLQPHSARDRSSLQASLWHMLRERGIVAAVHTCASGWRCSQTMQTPAECFGRSTSVMRASRSVRIGRFPSTARHATWSSKNKQNHSVWQHCRSLICRNHCTDSVPIRCAKVGHLVPREIDTMDMDGTFQADRRLRGCEGEYARDKVMEIRCGAVQCQAKLPRSGRCQVRRSDLQISPIARRSAHVKLRRPDKPTGPAGPSLERSEVLATYMDLQEARLRDAFKWFA
ncbi:hypothetical protein BV25DRAFT_1026978 [Artomyces pyxidatus]|uniref:Uncharacterized protein n=1 Tax=Artomyces pyxidatus TaxID=48021 RepID=A0ACB8SUD7_9AGAM|nr:hypothetical protein BV25DRAFT_1026978 [Artomyces pyxidatus]